MNAMNQNPTAHETYSLELVFCRAAAAVLTSEQLEYVLGAMETYLDARTSAHDRSNFVCGLRALAYRSRLRETLGTASPAKHESASAAR